MQSLKGFIKRIWSWMACKKPGCESEVFDLFSQRLKEREVEGGFLMPKVFAQDAINAIKACSPLARVTFSSVKMPALKGLAGYLVNDMPYPGMNEQPKATYPEKHKYPPKQRVGDKRRVVTKAFADGLKTPAVPSFTNLDYHIHSTLWAWKNQAKRWQHIKSNT